MAKLIDSSVWVALYLAKDDQHAQAKQFFASLTGKVYLPYCVLSEVATVLTYKHSKAQADTFVQFSQEHPSIKWIDSQGREDAAYFQTISAKISFIDTSLLRLSKELGVELITYDKQLARLYRAQKR